MDTYKRLISNPIDHKYWDTAFSKALKMPKLEYEEGQPIKDMTISIKEQRNQVLKDIRFKIEVEYENSDQSSFKIYELIGE